MCRFVYQRRFFIRWKRAFLKLFSGPIFLLLNRFSSKFPWRISLEKRQLRELSHSKKWPFEPAATATL